MVLRFPLIMFLVYLFFWGGVARCYALGELSHGDRLWAELACLHSYGLGYVGDGKEEPEMLVIEYVV